MGTATDLIAVGIQPEAAQKVQNALTGSITAAMAGTPGTIVVANTSVTANSRVLYGRATPGGTLGHLSYTIQPGVSITFLSTGNETSTIAYKVLEPAV